MPENTMLIMQQHCSGIIEFCRLSHCKKTSPLHRKIRQFRSIDKFTRLVTSPSQSRAHSNSISTQRASDYVDEWATQVNAYLQRTSGGGTKSTLVKRGAKSESADDPPSKRPKIEFGSSGVEEEVKRSFAKGAVSKVCI